jgi:phenylalanine-4-hydroxylase
MLSQRVFPVGNFIRKREQLDYVEAPDCFHDMFGHIPMLAHHDFAEMVEHVGRLGLTAIAADQGDRAARLYWHSVEFGLVRENGELKILGAGLASSFGEAHFSLESGTVERLPFPQPWPCTPLTSTTPSSRATWFPLRWTRPSPRS